MGSLAAAVADAPADGAVDGFGTAEFEASATLLDGAGDVPRPAVEARNAPNPTAATAIAPPTTNLRREIPLGGGTAAPAAAASAPATGRSGGGSPPASTAKVCVGDQTRRTSSPGSHNSARVARWTFCSYTVTEPPPRVSTI